MSWNFRKTSALVWLGLGLLAGLLVAGFWPSVPLHAVATDKIETFSMATGPVEPEYEAVYFLDHLTGDLHAYVVGRSAVAPSGFGVIQHCYRNVPQDFKTEGDKTPKFIMMTGVCDLNRTGRAASVLPSRSVLYIADVASGLAGVYAMPFNSTVHLSGRPVLNAEFIPICSFPIRKVIATGGKKGKGGDYSRSHAPRGNAVDGRSASMQRDGQLSPFAPRKLRCFRGATGDTYFRCDHRLTSGRGNLPFPGSPYPVAAHPHAGSHEGNDCDACLGFAADDLPPGRGTWDRPRSGQGRGSCCAGSGHLAARRQVAPEHQRVWLRLIEQRYSWAVLLTLKPEEAQREQARAAKLLRQKTIAWNDLLGFLRQLDQREKAAIARLVRQYRSEVYETFRKQPRDLVDRQEAWYRIWSPWEKAGSPPEQQDRLMDWLADAVKASTKDSIGPLPPDPKFGVDLQLVPEQLVKQLAQPPAGKPPVEAGGDQAGRAPPAGRRFPARSGVAGPWAAAAAGSRSAPGRRRGQAAVRGGRARGGPRTSRGCPCRRSRRRPSCRLCAACRHPRPGVPVTRPPTIPRN